MTDLPKRFRDQILRTCGRYGVTVSEMSVDETDTEFEIEITTTKSETIEFSVPDHYTPSHTLFETSLRTHLVETTK